MFRPELSKIIEPDHKASLEPDEFKGMIYAVVNIEKRIGLN